MDKIYTVDNLYWLLMVHITNFSNSNDPVELQVSAELLRQRHEEALETYCK